MRKGRLLCAIMAGALFLSALTGCGSKNKYEKLLDKDSPVTITIWHYYNGVQQAQFDEMVSEFNNSVGLEKGIVVEAISKSSIGELADSIIASANKEPGAESLPDVFSTYSDTAYLVDELGYIADLKKYFTEEELSEYVNEYIDEGDFNSADSLKIFPIAKSTEIMMINQTDWQEFAEATGDTYDDLSTWEGVAEVAEDYYNYTDNLTPDVPNDGKAFFGRDAIENYMNIGAKQLGSAFTVRDDNGNVEVKADKNVLRRLWENYYVPYVKGYYAAENRYRSDDAKIGSIIALVCSTTGAVYYPTEVTINDDYTYPIENVVLPVPNFEGCDPYIVQQGAGMSVIKSDEQKEYASVVFLKWFTETERNIQFAVNAGYLPVKKDANNYDKIISVSSDSDIEINETMKNTIATAIDEVSTYTLYTSPAFDASSELRGYIGNVMQSTADTAYKEISEKVAAGGDRVKLIEEYTNDAAFEAWYADFETGFNMIAEEK